MSYVMIVGLSAVGIELGDTIDTESERGSALYPGLVIVTVSDDVVAVGSPVAVRVCSEAGGNLFAAYGELGDIEYVELAGLDSINCFSDLCFCTFSNEVAESCCCNSVLCIAACPVGSNVSTVHNGLEDVLIANRPVVGSGSKNCITDVGHIDVVAYRVNFLAVFASSLNSGGSTGGVSVLTDNNAAAFDKKLSSFLFLIEMIPFRCVLNVHNNVRNNALDAEEECGVTGNNFSIGVSAYVADLNVAVSVLAVCRDLVSVHKFLELHTCNNAGNVARLINLSECVGEVVKAGSGSGVACHSDEVNVRIFSCNELHIVLMSVGVGDNDVTALSNEVSCCVGAVFGFGYEILPNYVFFLGVVDAESFACSLDAYDVSFGVAFGRVTDENTTDLYVGLFRSFLNFGCNAVNTAECSECGRIGVVAFVVIAFVGAGCEDGKGENRENANKHKGNDLFEH